ncbi:MAG: hypothetical protein ACRCYO_01595, partial [Bacteroidia bacterium]
MSNRRKEDIEYVDVIRNELNWLQSVMEYRTDSSFKRIDFDLIACPYIDYKMNSVYVHFILDNNLTKSERLLLIMCLSIHTHPEIFNLFSLRIGD